MNDTSIRAVVFDLGKVLLDFDYHIAAKHISAKGRLSPQGVIDCFMKMPLLLRYESGFITSSQFFEETCAVTGYCGAPGEFADYFGDIFLEIEPMTRLHASLRAMGLPTFIFSNTNEFAVQSIRQRFPFFANFDGYVLSYEQGYMKPDPRLYEVVEKVTGRSGSEILYLDDRPENIETGCARKWRTILHENPTETVDKVTRLGLLRQT